MNVIINKFIIRLLVFSLLLAAIAFGLTFLLPEKCISPVLFLLIPYFFSVTVIIFNYLVKSAEQKFNRFVNRFMMATFLKLMVYMAVLLAYVFTHKSDAVPFIITFLIFYAAYTVFDVIEILHFNKSSSPSA